MTWPPPALPTTRTNTTVMVNTHPAEHNAVNLAINDIVTRITRRGCRLSQSGQSIASGATVDLLWPTESFDSDGFHVAGSATMTIPVGLDGVYSITADIAAASPVAGGPAAANLQIAGSTRLWGLIPIGQTRTFCSGNIYLVAGQTVKVQIINGSNVALFYNGTMELWRVTGE